MADKKYIIPTQATIISLWFKMAEGGLGWGLGPISYLATRTPTSKEKGVIGSLFERFLFFLEKSSFLVFKAF